MHTTAAAASQFFIICLPDLPPRLCCASLASNPSPVLALTRTLNPLRLLSSPARSPAGADRTLLTWARLPLPLLYEGSQFCYPLRQYSLAAPLRQLALNRCAAAGWDSCLWHADLPTLAARSGEWRVAHLSALACPQCCVATCNCIALLLIALSERLHQPRTALQLL